MHFIQQSPTFHRLWAIPPPPHSSGEDAIRDNSKHVVFCMTMYYARLSSFPKSLPSAIRKNILALIHIFVHTSLSNMLCAFRIPIVLLPCPHTSSISFLVSQLVPIPWVPPISWRTEFGLGRRNRLLPREEWFVPLRLEIIQSVIRRRVPHLIQPFLHPLSFERSSCSFLNSLRSPTGVLVKVAQVSLISRLSRPHSFHLFRGNLCVEYIHITYIQTMFSLRDDLLV